MSQDKEREAFEAWAEKAGFNISRDETEKYREYHRTTTRWAWDAWQARAALATQPPAVQGEPVAWGWRSADGQIRDCIAPDTHAHQEGEYTIPLCLCTPSREVEPLTPESWEEIEAVIACLGDDAAQLREENAEDERAANMERAAEMLAFAYGIHSREGGSNV